MNFNLGVRDNFTKGIRRMLRTLSNLTGTQVSERDAERGVDLMAVKRKLGRSFFTRRLSPGTRAKRIGTLTKSERELAATQGWL